MGLFVQIPMQIAADLVGADHIAFLIGELFYVRKQMKILHKPTVFLLCIALKRTTVMLAISQAMRRDILKILGNRAYKIEVYRYRLSDIFRPGLPRSVKVLGSRPLVLTSCRINRRKGLELVVSAATLVLRVLPETTFHIRGPIDDAGYFGELRRMISDKSLERQVILVGEECAYEALPGILCSADVFVHPSLDESLGIAIMEALACGVPVVATSVGGIPETVKHGVNGLLVNPTPSCIAGAIISILTDSGLRDRLRHGAAAFAEYIREPTDADFDRMLDMKIRELREHR
jgi:glycosyltransferase involved in cell wall biosynthesis